MAHYPYCFTIDRLSLQAHLGWQAPERSVPQKVTIDMRIYFDAPLACMSDDNGSFLDYYALCNKVTQQVESREFRLIEYMTTELFNVVRATIDASKYPDARLWLRLAKSDAPVAHLENGASFVMSDLPAGAGVVDVG